MALRKEDAMKDHEVESVEMKINDGLMVLIKMNKGESTCAISIDEPEKRQYLTAHYWKWLALSAVAVNGALALFSLWALLYLAWRVFAQSFCSWENIVLLLSFAVIAVAVVGSIICLMKAVVKEGKTDALSYRSNALALFSSIAVYMAAFSLLFAIRVV